MRTHFHFWLILFDCFTWSRPFSLSFVSHTKLFNPFFCASFSHAFSVGQQPTTSIVSSILTTPCRNLLMEGIWISHSNQCGTGWIAYFKTIKEGGYSWVSYTSSISVTPWSCTEKIVKNSKPRWFKKIGSNKSSSTILGKASKSVCDAPLIRNLDAIPAHGV